METLSFAFGMLAMIAVALVAVVVVGMMKVIKTQKEVTTLAQWMDRRDTDLHQRISNEVNNLERVVADDRREINLRIDSFNSYVDSRLDKMENKFIGANSAKKQIIND
jgi:predicted PurR-regulated permease PerM